MDIPEDSTRPTPKIFGKSQSISNYLKSTQLAGQSPPEGLDCAALSDFLEKPKPQGVVRLVLVEDLSPTMIEVLGSILDLDPNVFSVHLNDARYSAGSNWDVNNHSEYSFPSNKSYPSDPADDAVRRKFSGMPTGMGPDFLSWSWKRKFFFRATGGDQVRTRRGDFTNIYRSFTPLKTLGYQSKWRSDDYFAGTAEERISFISRNDKQGSGWTGALSI